MAVGYSLHVEVDIWRELDCEIEFTMKRLRSADERAARETVLAE